MCLKIIRRTYFYVEISCYRRSGFKITITSQRKVPPVTLYAQSFSRCFLNICILLNIGTGEGRVEMSKGVGDGGGVIVGGETTQVAQSVNTNITSFKKIFLHI